MNAAVSKVSAAVLSKTLLPKLVLMPGCYRLSTRVSGQLNGHGANYTRRADT